MRCHCRCSSGQFVGLVGVALVLAIGAKSNAQDHETKRHRITLCRVSNPAFSCDGKRLLTVHGKVAFLWDLATGKELQRFEGHREAVRAVTFSPDGKQVLTGGGRERDMGSVSTDNSARLWDVATGKEIKRFEGHKSAVHAAQFSPDGRRILTVDRLSTARVWDVATGQQLFVYTGVGSLHPGAAFSPDGRSILGRVGRSGAMVWDAKTGKERCRIHVDREKSSFNSAEFSPNGEFVVTASSDNTARTWDAKTGRQVGVFAGHTSYVRHATFSADGKRILTASSDGTVRLWDANTAREIRRFKNPGPVGAVLLSRDGKRFFATWHADVGVTRKSGLSLWNVRSGQQIMQVSAGEIGHIVGFISNGKKFLVTKKGKPAALWDANTGKVVRRYD